MSRWVVELQACKYVGRPQRECVREITVHQRIERALFSTESDLGGGSGGSRYRVKNDNRGQLVASKVGDVPNDRKTGLRKDDPHGQGLFAGHVVIANRAAIRGFYSRNRDLV